MHELSHHNNYTQTHDCRSIVLFIMTQFLCFLIQCWQNFGGGDMPHLLYATQIHRYIFVMDQVVNSEPISMVHNLLQEAMGIIYLLSFLENNRNTSRGEEDQQGYSRITKMCLQCLTLHVVFQVWPWRSCHDSIATTHNADVLPG